MDFKELLKQKKELLKKQPFRNSNGGFIQKFMRSNIYVHARTIDPVPPITFLNRLFNG